MKHKKESPTKLFKTNISILNKQKEIKEYNFNDLYNQAMREESLKNPVRQLKCSFNPNISIGINNGYFTKANNSVNTSINASRLFKPRFNTEQLNIDKKIKEIRKNTKENGLDIQRKDNQIAFSKDKIDIVFESTRLLKEIYKRKENSLNDEDTSVSNFIADNKQIAIKNILIKLLHNESNKLKNTENDLNASLEEGQSNLINQQTTFNEIIEKQKAVCKEIENVLIEVQKSNLELAETEKAYKLTYKLMEDEVEKYVELINNKRIWAKFIHQVMKKDESLFAKDIIFGNEVSNSTNTEVSTLTQQGQQLKKPNYTQIARTVVNEYSFCLKQDINQLEILQSPLLMIDKFKDYEDYILKCLQFKKDLIDNYEKKTEENSSILSELQRREERLSEEESVLMKEVNALSSDVNIIKSNQMNQDADLLSLIRDLHSILCYNNNRDRDRDRDVRFNKAKSKLIQEVADESIEALKGIEMKINDLLRQLTLYENDSVSFYQIVNQRKNQNKEVKQKEAKYYLEHLQYLKKQKAEDKFNRLIIQTRKSEPPYFKFKKNKERAITDATQIQKVDDDDFLNYN